MARVSNSLTLILFFVILGLATLGWILVSEESLTGPPGAMGDDVYFENIAFQLAKNEGFSFNFTDPEWKRPYIESNHNRQNDWILLLEHRGLTTSRTPGFPVVISMIYRVVGRRFEVVRLINLLLLAGGIALLLQMVLREQGAIAAGLALLTISLDGFILRTAGQFMNEAIGTAILCILIWACVRLSTPTSTTATESPPSPIKWMMVGVLFGLGALIRANLNGWIPMILLGIMAAILWRFRSGQSWRHVVTSGFCFCVGIVVISAPWWVRNCLVTGGFAPVGTSGSFGLVGGYCDEAYADYGNWSLEASLESQRISMSKPGFFELALAKQEFLMGQDSVHLARQWIAEHWTQMPMLIGMKSVSHLGFYRQPIPLLCLNGLLFFGAVIGCYVTRSNLGFWVLACVVLSVVTTSLAWPHYGRYSIPLRPLIHLTCAIGTVACWREILLWVGWIKR